MINHSDIIEKLSLNAATFQSLFTGLFEEEYLWKPVPEKWCLLEVICHLYDEEREDFRGRLKQVLETPELPLPKIDPVGWVNERKYLEQNFSDMLSKFLGERKHSVEWLHSLKSPKWKNAYKHPKFGPLTAEMFLANWLAHDYLHFRQITFLKYHYLKTHFDTDLNYAGNW